MKKRVRTYSGTTSGAVSQREIENRVIARQAAAEGMVLLKNDGVLPLEKGSRVALFGGGAVKTIKGGTGSGDVNEREVVSIYQGFVDAGFELSNKQWLDNFAATYQKAREDWRNEILEDFEKNGKGSLIGAYSTHIFRMPTGEAMQPSDFEGVETGFYVISRTAGEDADRFAREGDYYLTDAEKKQLTYISNHCANVAVIINAGGQIDLEFILAIPNLKVLMVISQPGMEGGHALADVLIGDTVPSGKLVDTWALRYEDFPNAAAFSHNNGDIQNERYEEGQYVGYRYFDSFQQKVAYPFGFGLSYTQFAIHPDSIRVDGNTVTAAVTVKNSGSAYAGKEVVQVYASCPQTALHKVHRKLVAFAKTKLLAPGEEESIRIAFDAKHLAAFDEDRCAWVAEKGKYGVWIGNSSVDLQLAAVLENEQDAILEEVEPICRLREPLQELVCPDEIRLSQEQAWHELAVKKGVPVLPFAPTGRKHERHASVPAAEAAAELVEKLTDEELIAMVIGEISKGQGSQIGAAGIMVPGAAGETSSILDAKYDVPGVSMADGPAGLRLVNSYEVDLTTGNVINQGFVAALEGGFFADHSDHENARRYYQYATAIPVGTALAQTWNESLLEVVGRTVAGEMQEFGVSWWLAPGMNIHRNPLCGRNFEYYSEDPLVSGKMAAAITRGVQSVPGVGTTIKHFACNNQEDNRMGSNSILSQRTLREIYLRGFEIAVKEAQPMAIMTSYNLINGLHTANSWDLCTQAARNEWDFQGIIMTDWCTTFPRGGSTSWKCIAAGNDLIMPGYDGDMDSIRNALADGLLRREDLKACVRRLLTVIFQTLAYEDAVSYGARFL
ncbi:MAG: glycoside hydrolase family 3 C-terminal domain-containing protein [Faecousia sp.]